MPLSWPKDISTWVGLGGLILTGLFQLSKGHTDQALAAFSAAMALLGVGGAAASAAAHAKDAEVKAGFAAADLEAIRNDPQLPGAPLTDAERIERLRKTN